MSKKEQKMNKNGKVGVAILVMAWALKLVFLQGIYVFIIFFVWTCYLHTGAYRLGLSRTRIDTYWQNFVVLVAICGHKLNLHFTKIWTKNKDFNSVWQPKVPWMTGINAVTPSDNVPPETTTKIPFTWSEWRIFVKKTSEIENLRKNYFRWTKLYYGYKIIFFAFPKT